MGLKSGEIGAGRGLRFAFLLLVLTTFVPPAAFSQAEINASMSDSLVIDNDGDGSVDPGDTLRYRVEIGNATDTDQKGVGFEIYLDPNTILVPGFVRISPLALDDQYDAIGNISLVVPAAKGLLANDRDPDDPAMDGVLVTAYDAKTTAGGIAVVDATGGFTYVPPPGFRGLDTFGYTIKDADGFTDSATATIAIDSVVWFVDNTAPPGGPGTIIKPFDTLADVELVAAPDDVIYIFSGDGTSTGLDSGIVLEAGQRLLGQGVDLVIGEEVLVQAGAAPVLSATSGPAVSLAPGCEVSGLVIDSAVGIGIFGQNLAGPVRIASVTILNPVGDAIRLENVPGVSLSRVTFFNTGGSGIRGTSVGDFSIEDSQFVNIGNADGEYGIGFDNLRGTCSITNTSMTNVADTNVFVDSTSGTLDVLTVSNGTFTGGAASTHSGSGVFVRASAGAVIGSVTVADMIFRDLDGVGIDARAGLTAGLSAGFLENVAVERCTVENAQAGGVFLITEGTGQGTFGVRDCPQVEAKDAPGLIVRANDNSATTATVARSVFSMIEDASVGANCVRILNDAEGGRPTAEVTIHDNVVGSLSGSGIDAQSRGGGSRLDLRITDNTVSGNTATGMDVQSGSQPTGEADTVCLEISGNHRSEAGPSYEILLYQAGADTAFLLKNYTGSPTDTAAVAAFIEANNPNSVTLAVFDSGGFYPGDCTTPSP